LVDFQLEVYKFLSENQYDSNNLIKNLTIEEYNVLSRFLIHKPFKFVECDKNVGTALISHKLYEELCLKNLSGSDFESVVDDPLEKINLDIINKLNELVLNDDIPYQLKDFLILDNSKLGSYRLLMKLHKIKFSTRPIINSRSHPTENLSWLLDSILKPIIVKTESYIQDSQNLLQKIKNKKFPKDCKIYSCDFEGLYSNIDLSHALTTICDFMKDKFTSTYLNIKAFHIFLKLVFDNNYFTYNKKFYKQVKGIAMGTKCGPSIANIYLYILEKNFLFIHKPLHYSRFIDDIFIITSSDFDISILQTFFHNLKLNIDSNNNLVNFLDLTISLNLITLFLRINLYKKPTNTFQQLLVTSNHQKIIIENNPFGSFLRIRRICSYTHDFIYNSKILISQLITRGYTKKHLFKIYNTILNLNRDDLINYKIKKSIDFDNCILLRMNFDLNYVNIQKDIKKVFNNCFKDHPLLRQFKLKIINKTQTNLGSLTINNLNPDLLIPNTCFIKKCKKFSCRVCFYLEECYYLKLNNFYLTIEENMNCNTSNAVYAIKCCLCKDTFYIGETGRKVSSRINEHLRDIKNFTAYIQYNSVVADHFNRKGHNVSRDFKFCILKNSLPDLKERLDYENNFVHLFKNLGFKILNDPLRIKSVYNFGIQI
jgi:hypothetical protein